MRRIQIQINIRETPTRTIRQFVGPFIEFNGDQSMGDSFALARDAMLKQLEDAAVIAATRQPNSPHRGD